MSSKLHLDRRYHQLVVAPSGERLRGKGRHECNLQVLRCVIHA